MARRDIAHSGAVVGNSSDDAVVRSMLLRVPVRERACEGPQPDHVVSWGCGMGRNLRRITKPSVGASHDDLVRRHSEELPGVVVASNCQHWRDEGWQFVRFKGIRENSAWKARSETRRTQTDVLHGLLRRKHCLQLQNPC